MSLILDALKTSQREKERRESGGMPPARLVVPLRSRPRRDVTWRHFLGGGVLMLMVVAGVWAAYRRVGATTKEAGAPFRSSVPATMQMGSALLPRDTVAHDRAQSRAEGVASATLPQPETRLRNTDTLTPSPSVEIAHSRSTRDAAVVAARPMQPMAAATRAPADNGRLRIAIEQPRAYEAARFFTIGVAAQRAGDLDAARGAYERLLALSPNDVDALNNLGVLLGAQREYDRAEQVLRRAVRLAPRNAGAWSNLGTVLSQSGRTPEAIAAFQQALDIDPLNSGARVNLAQQHLAIGASRRARELLEEAVATSPQLAEAQYTLGQACEAQQDWGCAIRAYEAFVRVAPARMAADVERVRQRVQALSRKVG